MLVYERLDARGTMDTVTGSDHGLAALANRHGTPLFVYDGPAIAQALRELRGALHPAMNILYPLSVNPNISIAGLLGSNGATAGVSSLLELRAATMAGICPSDAVLLGPGRSRAELEACVLAGVRAVVVRSREGLAELAEIADARSVRQRVLLGIDVWSGDPDVAPAGDRAMHALGIDEAQALVAEWLAGGYPTLDIAGVYGYLADRTLDPVVAMANVARSLELVDRLAAATGLRLDMVGLSSGLRVACFDGESDADLSLLTTEIHHVAEAFYERHPKAQLLFDAGAFLTARGTTYLTRVRYVKEPSGQKLVVIDGAAPHLMAGAISRSADRIVPARLVGHPNGGKLDRWQVVGPLGTPTDPSLVHAALPRPRPGDLLVLDRCGVQDIAASPELLGGHGFPAEVLVGRDESYLIRSRDEPSDLLSKQRAHHLGNAHLDRSQIIEQIRFIAALRVDREAPVIGEETKLTELGLDGTSALELLMDLEQLAHFEVDPDQLDSGVFVTVGSLTDYVMMRIHGSARDQEAADASRHLADLSRR